MSAGKNVKSRTRGNTAPAKAARPSKKPKPDAPAPAPPADAAVPPRPGPAGGETRAPPPREPLAEELARHVPDFDALALNMSRLVEESGRALGNYVHAHEAEGASSGLSADVADAVKSIGRVAEFWMADPRRVAAAQTAIATRFLDLWSMTLKRLSGDAAEPVAAPATNDKRFSDPEWKENPIFDFLRQAYILTSSWAADLAARADEVDPHTREKAQFYIRQISSALSPSNFIGTNPELIRETFRQSGENLVRGMAMMADDIKAGGGALKIRQTDSSKFQLGVNLATTPGKVVFRNDLIELIQYAPSTPDVYKRPLLIVPPWINKFYVLDLNPEKSFIRWAVARGLTVFVISWVNPDERHANKDFTSYMREGVFAALDAVEEATGEEEVTAIGYCVGGTLLAVALAYMAATGDKRIASATFFTTQVDFTDAGELKVFVDEAQIQALESQMAERGYLEGKRMANAFNMLRPNELIWSYFVNNYLKGREPMPFDLLTWNSDSTRMPRANHSFYLRNCYLENNLTRKRMIIDDVALDLGKVTIPIYNLAAVEDHIAPARSVYVGAQFFGGPMRYVLAGSGHIAGVVNPATKPKYQYWTGGPPKGTFEEWRAAATENPGSWWTDWIAWITAQAPEKVGPRVPGAGGLKPLADAPGEYVRVRA